MYSIIQRIQDYKLRGITTYRKFKDLNTERMLLISMRTAFSRGLDFMLPYTFSWTSDIYHCLLDIDKIITKRLKEIDNVKK